MPAWTIAAASAAARSGRGEGMAGRGVRANVRTGCRPEGVPQPRHSPARSRRRSGQPAVRRRRDGVRRGGGVRDAGIARQHSGGVGEGGVEPLNASATPQRRTRSAYPLASARPSSRSRAWRTVPSAVTSSGWGAVSAVWQPQRYSTLDGRKTTSPSSRPSAVRPATRRGVPRTRRRRRAVARRRARLLPARRRAGAGPARCRGPRGRAAAAVCCPCDPSPRRPVHVPCTLLHGFLQRRSMQPRCNRLRTLHDFARCGTATRAAAVLHCPPRRAPAAHGDACTPLVRGFSPGRVGDGRGLRPNRRTRPTSDDARAFRLSRPLVPNHGPLPRRRQALAWPRNVRYPAPGTGTQTEGPR